MYDYLMNLQAGIGHYEQALAAYFTDSGAWMTDAALSLYALFSSLKILAYVSQFQKAARDENGASAISCTTWSLFLASHLTSIGYALACAHDILMAVVFLVNALACVAILGVALANRRSHGAKRRAAHHFAGAEQGRAA
ncbi:hypothetical protein [Oceanibium sediminis]|uniref:hypothetical protein n=1 Tax=Oceanibium sediminis TaxID=2026339 RepID=UPI000DD38A49|nr:hypothetical protein [Oceanibium sediminis]